METKSPFISAVESAVEDERLRWWVYYVVVVMLGSGVSSIDFSVFGAHPENYVASHPGLQTIDRCFFLLMLALTIIAVALWIGAIWKTSHAEIPARWFWVFFLIVNCSPFGPANRWLGRMPQAAELASTLHEARLFPLPFVLLWIVVVGYKQAQVANKKEVEAYIARKGSKPPDVAGLASAATEAARSGA